MTSHRITLLVGAVLFGIAGGAQAAGDITIVRDLASRVGPVIGSAQACRDIARPRIQTIVDKFSLVIREAASNEAERSDLTQVFDRSVTEGRTAVTSGRLDCIRADEDVHRPGLRPCVVNRQSGRRSPLQTRRHSAGAGDRSSVTGSTGALRAWEAHSERAAGWVPRWGSRPRRRRLRQGPRSKPRVPRVASFSVRASRVRP